MRSSSLFRKAGIAASILVAIFVSGGAAHAASGPASAAAAPAAAPVVKLDPKTFHSHSSTFTPDATGFASGTVMCPAGEQAVTGGAITGFSDRAQLTSSVPTKGNDGWHASAGFNGVPGSSLTVVVDCAPEAQLATVKTSSVAVAVPNAGPTEGRVLCRGSDVPFGGGVYFTDPAGTFKPDADVRILAMKNEEAGARSWKVVTMNGAVSDTLLMRVRGRCIAPEQLGPIIPGATVTIDFASGDPSSAASAVASCLQQPAGYAYFGDFEWVNTGSQFFRTQSSLPDPHGWQVTGGGGPAGSSLELRARCIPDP